MRLYLAVDCGGTKAAAVVCDARRRVLGRGLGGPANFTDVGWHVFFRSLRTAVDHAIAQVREHATHAGAADDDDGARLLDLCRLWAIQSRAWKRRSVHAGIVPTNLSPHVFEAAWLGVAGVDSATTVHLLSPPVAALLGLPPPPTPRLTVANDTSLLAAPVHDLPPRQNASRVGVVVIAGTGSIVTGYRLGKGSSDLASFGRVGGLGWLLGDEGSGYAVGREAVRAVLRQADAARFVNDSDDDDGDDDADDFSSLASDSEASSDGPAYPYALRDRILAEFGLSSTDELFGVIYAPDSETKEPASPQQQFPSAPSSPQSKRDDRLLPPGPSAPAPERPVTPVAPLSAERPGTPASQSATSEGEGDNSPTAQDKEATRDEQRAEETLSAAQEWAESVAGGPSGLRRDRTIRARRRDPPDTPAERKSAASQAPKHRLAALAPLVFHLAFVHGDPLALLVLRTQADCIARQIAELVRPMSRCGEDTVFWAWDYAGATQTGRHRRPRAKDAVLCMGGSLLGVDAYANMLLSQLAARGVHFARTCFVPDPARSGALALARVWEARLPSRAGSGDDVAIAEAEAALRSTKLGAAARANLPADTDHHSSQDTHKKMVPIPVVAEPV